jgi:hypothetical protein
MSLESETTTIDRLHRNINTNIQYNLNLTLLHYIIKILDQKKKIEGIFGWLEWVFFFFFKIVVRLIKLNKYKTRAL